MKFKSKFCYKWLTLRIFFPIFSYPVSYLASAHKDCSKGAFTNKKKLSPMIDIANNLLTFIWFFSWQTKSFFTKSKLIIPGTVTLTSLILFRTEHWSTQSVSNHAPSPDLSNKWRILSINNLNEIENVI